jgi:tetratricopeptide (TPR) repeat protein
VGRSAPHTLSAVLMAIFGSCLCVNTATAHEPPSEKIAELTQRMEMEGPNLELYTERAFEYLAQGNYAAAQRDLEYRIETGPPEADLFDALAEAYLALKHHDPALRAIESGLRLAHTAQDQATLYATRARVNVSSDSYAAALDDMQTALNLGFYDIEWAILRSRLQARLGRDRDRIRDLETACAANPSVVLQYELLDAHIDFDPDEETVAIVMGKLEKVRWKSTWELRLARIYLRQGQRDAARRLLEDAVEEIDGRYNPDKPHLGLMAERGEALALLGETERARRHWRLLQFEFPDSRLAYYRLDRLVNGSKPPLDGQRAGD